MQLSDAINGRRAVRDYAAEPVHEESIRRLIDAAIQAPSAVNEQPWAFTVVRDQAVLDRVSAAAKAHMLATLPPGGRSEHFRTLLDDADFQIFYHAPALILISGAADSAWIAEDCALAAENLMLAAYGEGLGSCWIGFAQAYLNTDEGKRALGLPADWKPVAPIIVGQPRTPAPPVPRKPPEIRWVG
ncbi:MAG: nitroreductase [Caulobacteraceae bacterium]|nr:nitroreductase [Caulobacteraceae bacterium]